MGSIILDNIYKYKELFSDGFCGAKIIILMSSYDENMDVKGAIGMIYIYL